MYQIGQVCIGQNIVYDDKYNGMECEIIGELIERTGKSKWGKEVTLDAYEVRWADGLEIYVLPEYLRPKHEPGSWDELEKMIGWRPNADKTIKESETTGIHYDNGHKWEEKE